ncbi:MAG: hypothetical protein LIP09_14235 [Bacteroidales bacterium]|nr:hypothetical protein [Bacteroidales bacterium]MCC8119887.1 hypothetical protein [Bacteroidales bacterium]
METEQIISKVTEQLGQTSLSERTIKEIVALNPVAEGQEPDEQYFNHVVGILKTVNGQLSHDIAAQVENFKKNYNPQPRSATPNVTITPPIEPKPGANSELEEIKRQIAALAKAREDDNIAAAKNRLKAEIKELMMQSGADNEGILDLVLASADIKADKTAADQVQGLLGNYDKTFTKIMGAGAVPRSGNNGGKSERNPMLDAFFEKKKKKMGKA